LTGRQRTVFRPAPFSNARINRRATRGQCFLAKSHSQTRTTVPSRPYVRIAFPTVPHASTC